MRSEDVAHLVAVADSPSLNAAARALGISQPTLSKSIARLERALGLPVIERHARGVTLTEAGRSFLEHARPAVAGLRDGLAAVRELRGGRHGNVRIGLGVGVPASLAIEALRPVLARPGTNVEIIGGMSDTLSRALAAGSCDFCITNLPPDSALPIHWEPMFSDPMTAVVAPGHPLAGARRVDWPTLSRQLWVTPGTGTRVRDWFERLFLDRGLPVPARMLSLRDYSGAAQVGAALGAVGLTPVSFLRGEPRPRRFVELATPADWRSDRVVGIARRRGGFLSPAAQRLIARFEEVGRRRFPTLPSTGAG
jgi:DNA-binding transcriptional LysR family regulator